MVLLHMWILAFCKTIGNSLKKQLILQFIHSFIKNKETNNYHDDDDNNYLDDDDDSPSFSSSSPSYNFY